MLRRFDLRDSMEDMSVSRVLGLRNLGTNAYDGICKLGVLGWGVWIEGLLMENSAGKSGGAEISRKTRSLDIQSLYKASVSKKEGNNKRKSVVVDDGEVRKKKRKSRKEVSLSSFEQADKKSRNSLDEVYGDGVSSDSRYSEKLHLGLSRKLDSSGGFNSISLNLDGNGSVIRIPKRRRDFVGRKKCEKNKVSRSLATSSSRVGGSVDQIVKLNDECKKFEGNQVSNKLGPTGGKASSAGQTVKLNDDSAGKVVSPNPKVKEKTGFDDSKENRTSRVNSARHAKEEDGHLIVNNGDVSSKRRRSNHRKRNELSSGSESLAKKVEPLADNSPDEDEENLEQNAARMLSSRFDPRCTGFSSKNRSTASSNTNELSFLVPSAQDFVGGTESLSAVLESTSVDTASRILRPRSQHKEKGLLRKRRHFYEVLSRDLDAKWVLNRKIKVFWPLDESWYFGLVNDYDPKTKLHHIKYDDRDEEWVNLENERFKLLLLPSEVPRKIEAKTAPTGNKHDDKGKQELTSDDDSFVGSYMDSEPIISWLVRSSHRVKSSPLDVSKRQKTSLLSTKTDGEHECLDMGSSERDMNKPSSNSALRDGFTGTRRGKKLVLEGSCCAKDSKSPVVYFRRRFHKKDKGLCNELEDNNAWGSTPVSVTSLVPVGHNFHASKADEISLGHMDSEGLLWSVDNSGLLKLTVPLVNYKQFRFELGCPLPVLRYIYLAENSWLIRVVLLLHYGTLMTTWPKVHLEMLFVDNIVGLRFLLFEGCLKQAVAFVFLVLTVFYQPNNVHGKYVDMEMPVTSIRFKLSCIEDLRKQLVFAFYSFSKVKYSKWLYLDCKLQQHCLLTKQLPLSECTYDNIKALEGGRNQLRLSSSNRELSAFEGLRKKSMHGILPIGASRESCVVAMSQSSCNSDAKHGIFFPFSLSFTAAPSFFLSLHLKLLMENSVACISHDLMYSLEHSENTGQPIADSCTVIQDCSESALEITPEGNPATSLREAESSEWLPCAKSQLGPDTISECNDLAWNMSDGIVRSPNPSGSRSVWHHNNNSSNCSFGDTSHLWPNGKADFISNGFGNGPKKPRTQVQYTLPFGGFNSRSKHPMHSPRGLPYKRIRKANEKRTSDGSRNSHRNFELLACDANVLITIGDRGWREFGARVVLELADHNEWRLAVKLSGTTKYSYKAHQFLQPGSTNRYTHAMMWRGGKDWVLEFPDRSQWMLFKELHEECHNRNIRAASVKNIPIPGVHLIEECDDGTEVPFIRSSPKYFRQVENDVDMAMDPSRILYDMDSDDEQWISENRKSSHAHVSKCEEISEELFEKTMDIFEKVAYAQQRDHFTSDEIEKFVVGVGPMEVIKVIHEHWRLKRQRKGLPLIRHLQPPLWERYEQQVREWEQTMAKANTVLTNGSHGKAPPMEKPPMFAFCLKPRGLEVPNKGSKHRPHRKFLVSGHNHAGLVDQDGLHAFGRRSNGFAFGDEKVMFEGNNHESDAFPLFQTSTKVFSPRAAGGSAYFPLSSDWSEWNRHPKLHRNKSKKIGTFLSPNNPPMVASYNQRAIGKRNGVHRWNMGFPEWPSQKHYQSEGSLRHGVEQLDGSDLDEFRLRDASGAAQHALNMAKLKRENAQRLLYRADLAIHKAVVALMTAEAIKAASEDSNGDV
ncbi:unnamed protein product [Camellia sinensis]